MGARPIAEENVVVIGASLAGLFVADRVARAGRTVSLHDRATSLDPEPRTLIVTQKMKDLLGPLGDRSVLNEIKRFELCANGTVGEIELDHPDLIIERAVLIENLAANAQASGASLHFGQRFTGLSDQDGALGVRISGQEEGDDSLITTRTLVGADGTASKVARIAGWPKQPTVSLVQAIVDLPSNLPPDTTRVWFRPDETPFFYWLIPESAERGALGVIGVDGSRMRRRLDSFLEQQDLTPISYQAGTIPLYRRWIPEKRRLPGGDVYLAGDAAGQVKVSTVGGVVTGLRGALGVAESIIEGRSAQMRPLRRELNVHLLIHRALRNFTESDWIYLLNHMDPGAKRSMTSSSRDDASRILLSLCRSKPRLILKGIRSLIGGAS